MSDWHRTPLPKKYRAVKMLSATMRTWGDKFTPQFRLIGRELKMKPQNLVFMWNNRDAIVERAERTLPASVRNRIEKETEERISIDAEKLLKTFEGKDYKKMNLRYFIKGFDAMTDAMIKLKMIQ